MQHYAAIKERLVAGSDTAIIGVDDIYCAQIADRLERAGKDVVRISKRLPLADGYFADGADLMEARAWPLQPRRLPRRHRLAARPAQCAERAGRGRRLPQASASTSARSRPGSRAFPGLAASHGAGRPQGPRPLRQRFQGDQCRRGGAGAVELPAHLLDRRRPAQGGRHRAAARASSRASPRPT